MAEEQIHVTWLNSDRTVPTRFVRPLLRFTRIESAGGIVLLVSAVVALVWANAPFGETYEEFWDTVIDFSVGGFHFSETLRAFVNDGLMAIFFFVVGLEIKREMVIGDLRDRKAAALPVFAALGGMIVPALLYVTIVGGGDATRGWGIPMATDIAFSVGILSLMGRRVPVGAKLFLLAVAIADDIGAIVVIAFFYTEDLFLGWLGAAIAGLVLVAVASRVGIRSMVFYGVTGVVIWFFLLESGVHATLAGVALGFLAPALPMYSDREYHEKAQRVLDRQEFDAEAPRSSERINQDALAVSAIARESVPPLRRLEEALHPWSSFLIVPIFALANAGVGFSGVDLAEAATHPVALGVAIGLLAGKTAGITTFAFVAVRLGLARLPRFTTWGHIAGVAAVAGIGFTVSLFVTGLAFPAGLLADRAKTGIFIGSTLAGLLGWLILRAMQPTPSGEHPNPTGAAPPEPAPVDAR